MSLPRDTSSPSLHSVSMNNNSFSLYAESSSTRSADSPSLSRRHIDSSSSIEPVLNFVPPKM